MEDKDKLESLKSIAELHRGLFNERRKYEWKILLTSLTFIVLTAVAILKGEISISGIPVLGIAPLVLALFTSGYFIFIHLANHTNKEIAEKAQDAILDILNKKDGQIDLFPPRRRWYSCRLLWNWAQAGAWAWFWQTTILLLFGFLASVIIAK